MIALRPYGEGDEVLTALMECDPEMMRHLGGPVPREDIPSIHERRLGYARKGAWLFVILVDGEPAGTTGLWQTEAGGVPVNEMSWMVLPEFQGRGAATEAARRLIARARAELELRLLDAVPNVANEASNAVCRKLGFSLIGTLDGDYRGRKFACNRWRLDLDRK